MSRQGKDRNTKEQGPETMRVFELARELNIPGKDLIERMKSFGYTVEGNFNQLDDKTVSEVKSKMLEPVTRIEEQPATAGEGEDEAEEQPRRRRIISAKRSGEVKKIQESLGIDGPLPEDQQTRDAVTPTTKRKKTKKEIAGEEQALEGQAPPADSATEEVEQAAPAEIAAEGATPANGGEELAAGEAPPATGEIAGEGTGESAKETPGEVTEPAQRVVKLHQPRPVVGIPLPKPVDVTATRNPRPGGGEEWRDMKGGGRKRGGAGGDGAGRGTWRDMKRDRKGGGWGGGGDDEWGRGRGRGRKGRKPPRGGSDENRHTFNPRQKAIRIGEAIRVSDFAGAIGVKATEIIKKLMGLGLMVTINDSIESTTAELIATEYDIELEVAASHVEMLIAEEAIEEGDLESRPPIVTIMGHVDHGKTTLLDYIRSTRVASSEAGGITQHIGAYFVKSKIGDVVFLDTPGHEAFTSLRQRGANVTDIVVLIVAADDGVMPQTVEAIDHAKAADVPIIVAINKIDRPNADPGKIKQQMMEHGLVPEEFGGDTVVVPLSATTGEGVDNLLDIIHLQAEILELKTTTKGKPRGHIIEAQMDRRRGPIATLILERGIMKVGDFFVVGETSGRVRAIYDDQGEPLEAATPSRPVEILGFDAVAAAGDLLTVMNDEKDAREVAQSRVQQKQEQEIKEGRRVSLEAFLDLVESTEEAITLNIVLKADTQGSLEALRSSLEKEGDARVKVQLIRAGVGGITETDVSLATTSNAVVLGFSVRPETKASELARGEGVEIKTYTVIYDLIDDIHAALLGLLKPIQREDVIGRLEVLDVFNNTKEGRIAGGRITEGRMETNCPVRVYRDDVLIHSGQLNSLRRFKDDVASVPSGQECGFRLTNYSDLRTGDLIEAVHRYEEDPTLERAGRA